MYKLLIILLSAILLSGCTVPMSKASYLDEFRAFVVGIEQSPKKDAEEFWMNNLEMYEKFVGEWHDKFAGNFTWQEEIEIGQLQLRFRLMHSSYIATRMISGMQEDYTEIRDELKFYAENNMQADIDSLLDNARRSGEAVYARISALVKEIESDVTR